METAERESKSDRIRGQRIGLELYDEESWAGYGSAGDATVTGMSESDYDEGPAIEVDMGDGCLCDFMLEDGMMVGEPAWRINPMDLAALQGMA